MQEENKTNLNCASLWRAFRAAAPQTLPVFAGYLVLALGSVLPFSTDGVDFVMTAMFVVIFLNQWEKEKQHASAIIGIAAPLVCLRIFGSGSFLIPSMVCILAALLLFRRPIEAKESEAARCLRWWSIWALCCPLPSSECSSSTASRASASPRAATASRRPSPSV